MSRSPVDHLRLVCSNGVAMAGAKRAQNDGQLQLPKGEPKPRRQAGKSNVWLAPKMRARLDESKAIVADRIGCDLDNTQLVHYLLDFALKQLRKEHRAEMEAQAAEKEESRSRTVDSLPSSGSSKLL